MSLESGSVEWARGITKGTPNNETSFVRIPDRPIIGGNPWNLIESKFITTAEYAQESFTVVKEFVGKMDDLVYELELRDPGEITVEVPDVPALDVTQRPDFGDLDLNINWPVNTSVKPTIEDLPDFTAIPLPAKTITYPVFQFPMAPEIGNVPAMAERPNVLIPEDIVMDALVLPPPPVLEAIFIPSAPSIVIPELDAKFTDINLPEPVGLNWNENPFNSDIWNVFLDNVVTNIRSGGTGLAPEVEQAIYERLLNRMSYKHAEAYQAEEQKWVSLGWDEPPGALRSRLSELAAEQTRDALDASRDIMISQAELAQKNTHFYMELGRQSEEILRAFHNAQSDRLLKASEVIAKNSIDILNAYINIRNSNIDVYKTEVLVYTEKIKALLVSTEIFKSQIEGAKVSAEVQKIYVDLYQAQVASLEVIAKYYSVLLENRKISMEIEKTKIDIYKADADVFIALQTAEKIKAEIYGSQVQAEKTKADALTSQLQAYVEEVKAIREANLIELQRLEFILKKNEGSLEVYKTELSAYGIEVTTEAKRIEAETRGFEANITAYSAETSAQGMYYQTKAEEIKAKIEEARLNLAIQEAKVDSITKSYVALKELQVKGIDGVMGVASQLSASAMNAVNASTSYGYSASHSMGTNFSYGASISENHSFPHDPEV